MASPSVSHEQFIAHAMSISPHRNAIIDFSDSSPTAVSSAK